MRLALAELENLAGDVLSWRELMAGGPSWLTGELAATEAARARLRAWFLAGTLRRASGPSRSELAEQLQYLGDDEIRSLALDVLTPLPPPVIEHVLAAVLFVGVGRGAAGLTAWVSPTATPAAAEGMGLVLVTLDGHRDDEALRLVAAHEIAHAWLGKLPRAETMRRPAEGLAALRELGRAAQMWAGPEPWPGLEVLRDMRNQQVRTEQLAVRLARSWGYADDEDRNAQGALRVLAMRMEADQ